MSTEIQLKKDVPWWINHQLPMEQITRSWFEKEWVIKHICDHLAWVRGCMHATTTQYSVTFSPLYTIIMWCHKLQAHFNIHSKFIYVPHIILIVKLFRTATIQPSMSSQKLK
jgi:hypothetical protein